MTLLAESRQKAQSFVRGVELRVKQSLIGGGESSGGLGGGDFRREARQQEFFSQFQSWVYACTDLIARRIAGQMINVGEVEGSAQKAFDSLKFHEGEAKPIPNHPLLAHLHKPNPAQTKFSFIYTWVINLLLTGEAYLIVEGEGEDMLSWAVPTSWITPKHDGGLFTGYKLQMGSMGQKVDLKAENVARWYLPHPTNIKAAYSPLDAILRAVRVDEKIQESQEQMFERGMFPNVAITIGQTVGPDGKPTGRRPKLEGHQRRQIIGAILEIWRNSVGQGDPAILDGLIEKIEKLDRSPKEMDWEKSGEIVKKRICQIYRVNPIVLGEIAGVNRAQAAVAEASLCNNALNPLVNTASEALTEFYGQKFESNKKLLVWIEPCAPVDPEMRDKRLSDALKQGAISVNEWRAVYGFPARPEEEDERSPLLSTVGGMTGTVAIMAAVAQGAMTRESASLLLQEFLGIDAKRADEIAGVGQQETAPVLDQVDERLAAFMGSIKGLVELQEFRRLREESHG